MATIKNERYLRHFKKGKIEPIWPKEFYENLNKIESKQHLTQLLKDFFLLLYWTGRRPVEILELRGENFRRTTLKERDEVWKDYLVIDADTKKGGKPVEIFLVFDQIPGLKEFWERISGAPADFPIFALLKCKDIQNVWWFSKKGKKMEKVYPRPAKLVYWWSKKYFGVPTYFFRHNRFSIMKNQGASFEDIKIFKGAKTMKSVEPYISPDEETLRALGRKISV